MPKILKVMFMMFYTMESVYAVIPDICLFVFLDFIFFSEVKDLEDGKETKLITFLSGGDCIRILQ